METLDNIKTSDRGNDHRLHCKLKRFSTGGLRTHPKTEEKMNNKGNNDIDHYISNKTVIIYFIDKALFSMLRIRGGGGACLIEACASSS